MNRLWLTGSLVCFVLAGCAAAPGGGHVVGNPIVSETASGRAAKDAQSCGCSHHHKGKKEKASCGAASSCEQGQCGCDHESEGGCGCHHD